MLAVLLQRRKQATLENVNGMNADDCGDNLVLHFSSLLVLHIILYSLWSKNVATLFCATNNLLSI